MHCLKYKIKTKAPVLISKSSGDMNLVSTLNYIPGTVVLGIFAGRYIQKKNLGKDAHINPEFQSWYLNSKLTFTNAYIISIDDVGRQFNNIPIPYSVRKKKKEESEILDQLLLEKKDDRTKTLSGFGRINKGDLYPQPVNKSINFHHARDTKTGASKKGIIFNYESIDAGQEFEGSVIADKNILTELLNEFKEETDFYIGRSRNSQYGKIEFEFLSTDPVVLKSEIVPNGNEISLTFLSDVIIYNNNGFSITDVKDLKVYLLEKVSDNNFKIDRAFIKKGVIENYVSVWNLKKPSDNCFKAGSCFLLKFDNIDNALEKLKELQIQGIGERKAEGFGRIEFGLQKSESYMLGDYKNISIDKPPGNIPEVTKGTITKMYKDLMLKQIRLNAIDDVIHFKDSNKNIENDLSNSLISRLESFVKQSSNQETFKNYVENLKKPAKDKLYALKIKEEDKFKSFHYFLSSKEVNASDVLIKTQFDKLKNSDEIKEIYNPNKDERFNDILYKDYFITFFTTLRKLLKKEKLKENEQREITYKG